MKVFVDGKSQNIGVNAAHFYCFKKYSADYFIWLDVGDELPIDFYKK